MRKIHTLFTGKITFILSLLLLSLGSTSLSAQCLSATYGQWPSGTVLVNCTGAPQNITPNGYSGEYSRITVTSGTTYTFTSSITTDFITIGNAAGTTALASGTTPLVWTSTVSGNIRFYTHTDAACGDEDEDRIRAVTCAAPACPPPTSVSAGAVTTTGATISWSGTGNFILEYGPAGFTPGTGATAGGGTIIDPAVSPQIIGGLAPGTPYNVYVRNNCTGSSSGFSTNSTVSFTTPAPPPPNDAICNAIALTLDGPADCQNTSGATSTGDPAISCSTPNNTVWYQYTPAVSGPVQVTMTTPATGDALSAWVTVHSSSDGTCSGVLTQVAPLTDCYNGTDGTNSNTALFVTESLTAGVPYYIMIDGFSGDFGSYCMSLQTPPAPPAACATLLQPANAATDVPTNPGTSFVWNSVPGATGYHFYIGDALATMAPLLDATDTTTIIYGFDVNTTYYWYVIPFNIGGEVAGCDASPFSFTTAATVVNDECSGAIDISDQSVSLGSNSGATESMPGGICSDGAGANDVWYKLTAGASGSVTVTQEVPTFEDLVLEVLSGDCSSPLELDCDNSSAFTGFNEITFTATAGGIYYIRSYGYSGVEVAGFGLQATGTPLPVTMSALNGKLTATNMAQLSWTTFGEQNNAGFYIQRSTDGRTFTNAGFAGSKAVNGNSSSNINYSYADQQAVNGTVYYRLQQTDKDGKSTFSNIVGLAAQTNGAVEIIATPNPVNNMLTVKAVGASGKNPTLRLMDLTGKLIQEIPVTSAVTAIDMSGLSSGMYMIRYTDESFNHTIKISKQ